MFAALLLLMGTSAFAAQPERDKKVQLVIEKGSLTSVLEQFSRQTGLQVITQLNVAESKTDEAGPFIGYATPDEAMTTLLRDTDLSFKRQDEYTISIFKTSIEPPRSDDGVQEVLVTGTRLRNFDDGPAPVRVYSHGQIG